MISCSQCNCCFFSYLNIFFPNIRFIPNWCIMITPQLFKLIIHFFCFSSFHFERYGISISHSIPTLSNDLPFKLNGMELMSYRHNKARVPYVHQIFTVNVAFFTVFHRMCAPLRFNIVYVMFSMYNCQQPTVRT